MAEVKMNLTRLNTGELISKMKNHAELAAPASPAAPPIANMTGAVASLNAKIAETEAANNAYEAAKAAAASLKTVRDEKADELRTEGKLFAKRAETESQGEPGPLQALGFLLASTSPSATDPVPKLQNLMVTAGDMDGSLDASCDPPSSVPVKTYQWAYTTVDPVSGPYIDTEPTTASQTTISGLTSGQRVWIRNRGVNSKGPGPWSDPATKIVP